MAETSNYGLYVTDDSSVSFRKFRDELVGETDSNMTKIDAALVQKAEHSNQAVGVLLASAWAGDHAPYTQEIAVEGLGAEQNGHILLADSASDEENIAAASAKLSVSGQTEGALTITAKGFRPECDIPVAIVLLG